MRGMLIPRVGGDAIPLIQDTVTIGRRPDCDIRLPFPNVSGKHCELRFQRGTWVVVDLKSTNGTRVNGEKVLKKKLVSGDEITFARKHHFRIEFEMDAAALAAASRTPDRDEDAEEDSVFRRSLLDRAGLNKAAINDVDEDVDDGADPPTPPIRERKPKSRAD